MGSRVAVPVVPLIDETVLGTANALGYDAGFGYTTLRVSQGWERVLSTPGASLHALLCPVLTNSANAVGLPT